MSKAKSLMGRPVMQQGKRTKKIGARFTEDEHQQVLALEKQLGLSETDLVRMRLLADTSRLIVNAKDLIGEIDRLGAELGRVGNNINQLARHANTLKLAGTLQPAVIIRFNELFEQYLVIQQSIEVALRKIIRAMGK